MLNLESRKVNDKEREQKIVNLVLNEIKVQASFDVKPFDGGINVIISVPKVCSILYRVVICEIDTQPEILDIQERKIKYDEKAYKCNIGSGEIRFVTFDASSNIIQHNFNK